MAEQERPAGHASSTSPYMPHFETFRAELDEHHDRRERIIKASRDITAASKKMYDSLHMTDIDLLADQEQNIRASEKPLSQSTVKSNQQYYSTISTQLSSVSRDLQGTNGHRYARQISGGCQEYIEAASFQHYLTEARIFSYDEAVDMVRELDPEGPGIELSMEDYILGIYDMTGELMKFAITAMATSGTLPTVSTPSGPQRNVLTDMRELRSALESLDTAHGPFARDVEKKMEVMRQSVEKVEKALYGLTVRGAERPPGWMPDVSAVEVEG